MAEKEKTNTETQKSKKKTASKTSSKAAAGSKEIKAKKAAPVGDETAAAQAAAPKAKKAAQPAAPRAERLPRSYFAKPGEHSERWQIIDASGQTLGRLSTHIAMALMGKDKPSYTRHIDSGAHVVVINAAKVALTGNKWRDKMYHYHTNYPGGLKSFSARDLLEKHPERLIERAVYGMLPKGHMGRRWFKKLRVFAGADHPHQAQKPEVVKLPYLGTTEKRA